MHSAKQTPEAQIPAAGMLSVNANAKEQVVSQGLRCEFWQKHSAFSILPFYSSFSLMSYLLRYQFIGYGDSQDICFWHSRKRKL